ncbi:MAG: hypothetical protein ACYTDY_03945 [Planctomycetota bacterium]|jgi:hypothetical protein
MLKVYFGDRTFFQHLSKSFGNVFFGNQTSFFPRARLRTERDCL